MAVTANTGSFGRRTLTRKVLRLAMSLQKQRGAGKKGHREQMAEDEERSEQRM